MYRYIIPSLLLFISFTSEQSISNETSKNSDLEVYEVECANALSNALDTLKLPGAFKKIGASNIEITRNRDHTTPVIYEEELNAFGGHTRLYYVSYNASFSVNGHIKNIRLRVGGLPHRDIVPFDDTEVLKRLKTIFGNLPEKALSLVDIIYIKHTISSSYEVLRIEESDDDKRIGGQSGITKFQEHYIIIYFELPQNHPAYRNKPHPEDIILQGLYHAEMTMPHELGHVIARHKYNETTTPDQKYRDAVLADNISISEYGDESFAEDFAEAMQLYIMTNGGLYYPNLTRRHAHRFAILDEIMGVIPSKRRKIIEINDLFEIQTNDLLKKFGLPTDDFKFTKGVPNDVSEFFQNPLEGMSLETRFTESLRDSWRHNYENLKISEILANKIHALQKEKSLDFNSIENRLTRQILGFIRTDNISQFIIKTIHSFDTLSDFEMEYRLYILEQATNSSIKSNGRITLKQALEEALKTFK